MHYCRKENILDKYNVKYVVSVINKFPGFLLPVYYHNGLYFGTTIDDFGRIESFYECSDINKYTVVIEVKRHESLSRAVGDKALFCFALSSDCLKMAEENEIKEFVAEYRDEKVKKEDLVDESKLFFWQKVFYFLEDYEGWLIFLRHISIDIKSKYKFWFVSEYSNIIDHLIKENINKRDEGNRIFKAKVLGGRPINGTIKISGHVESTIPILIAATLCNEPVIISNVPNTKAVCEVIRAIRSIGAKIGWIDKNRIIVFGTQITNYIIDDISNFKYAKYFIGILLTKIGRARIVVEHNSQFRKDILDLDIKYLEEYGANCRFENGDLVVTSEKLDSAKIYFDDISTESTILAMLIACNIKGGTQLINVAKDPEVVDVASFLNAIGVRVFGAGTDRIRVIGGKEFKGINYSVVSSPLEAELYMACAAVTKGNIRIRNAIPNHLRAFFAILREMGIEIVVDGDEILINANTKGESSLKTISADYFPGITKNEQTIIISILMILKEKFVISGALSAANFQYFNEFQKLGIDIAYRDSTDIYVDGNYQMTGSEVQAIDLVNGMAVLIATLGIKDLSKILGIDKVFDEIPYIFEQLKYLGAKIIIDKPKQAKKKEVKKKIV